MAHQRVAIFANSLRLGGAERVAVNLVAGFARFGHEVDLVLVSEHGELLRHVHENVHVIDLDSDRVLRSVLPLRRYLSRHHPDALISIGAHVNLVATWACSSVRPSPTLLLTEHSIIKRMSNNRKATVMQLLAHLCYRVSDSVVAVSEGVLDDLRSDIGYHGDARVIYNPILSEQLLSEAAEPLDHPWFSDDIPVILGAGRLAPEKDFSTLIQAFAELRERREARLVITGSGPQREHLESLISSLGLNRWVDLAGYVENVYQYMSNADVFVLSSLNEGFGMVVAEALACGTPVVSTDCPSGPAEILADGRYGSLVPVASPSAMADAVADMLNDPTDPTLIAQRAQEFSVDRVTEQYNALIAEFE
ncbi:glycosyltransferase [Halogeometricum luteum]|uniref:Glycosyltransferase n=1 Tax=Halogeometricum luteum TaxID=2950537 RepID=A0ABU2FXX1_9EURY|nr:glycosyltransferase [Halogeometricum sp. S3BR5-2]MDS0292778.1 glycosyltransferase [Halogeometricum sp. S3BR5-2]